MAEGIVVFAYSDVGYECLKALIDRKEKILCVYTHENKAGENIWFQSVEDLATKNAIPVRKNENLGDPNEIEFLSRHSIDLMFSFYYRNLIPTAVLKLARRGAFNMHGSLLPRYRGRAPVNWAILNGETKTGATLHVMVEKADAGDVVDQEAVSIGPDETAIEVQRKISMAAVNVLNRQIQNLKDGRAPRHPQDPSQASIFGRRTPADGIIDWSWPAHRIHNLVRALTHPFPGAFGLLNGKKTWIWRTCLSLPSGGADQCDYLEIPCGDGKILYVLSLQQEGAPELSAREFRERQVLTATPFR